MRNPYAITPAQHDRNNKTISDNLYFDSIDRGIFKLSNFLIPGPFANDAAAATAGIQIGGAYYIANGTVVVRLT